MEEMQRDALKFFNKKKTKREYMTLDASMQHRICDLPKKSCIILQRQLRSRLEQQQLDATNFIREILVGNSNCAMMLNNDQHAILGSVPNLQAEMPNSMTLKCLIL